jgi:hypothetical protein
VWLDEPIPDYLYRNDDYMDGSTFNIVDLMVYEITELKPWKWHIPKKPAKYIVEFDKREFNDCLKIGDEIEIK